MGNKLVRRISRQRVISRDEDVMRMKAKIGYRIAELYFADAATLNKALGTDDGQKAAGHAMAIATGGVDMMVVDVERDS